jgi:hypothetical protein
MPAAFICLACQLFIDNRPSATALLSDPDS